MITEGSDKAIPEANCVRQKNMIALENKFLTRSGYKKFNSVPYSGHINLIYEFKRIAGGTLNITAFGNSLFVGTPTYASAPVANAGIDQSGVTGATVMLNGTASERAISYLWTQTSGTTVTLSDTTSATPTFTMPASDATFSLKVTNSWGSDTDTVDVTEAFAGTLIHNCVELQAMQDDLAGNYKLANAIDCTYCTQDPAGALYNGGLGFKPVGDGDNKFTGIFDGNGHTITGLKINRLFGEVGLFGSINNSEIKNVGMINIDVGNSEITGGLIGCGYGSTVTNCYSTGSVSGERHTGGLIGCLYNGSTITNCYSTVAVNGGDFTYIGGLIGNCQTGATITNCYSTGSVSGGELVGGLIGYFYGWQQAVLITNCYATGAVSGRERVGGLIGEFARDATVTNCYSTGSVSGDSRLGGLIGYHWLGESTVTDSFWDTQTSGQAASAGGTGKTTAQMKQEATFTNWDFSTIWEIVEDTSYPTLR